MAENTLDNRKKNEQLQHRTFEFILGLFFIGAVFILIYFTVFVNGKDLFFSSKRHFIKVEFPSVASLSENDKVCVKGMKIGTVKSFDVSPDFQKIIITLSLEKQVPFYKNYSIEIQDASVFGGQIIQIDPGTPDLGKVDMSTPLNGKEPRDILNDASKLISLLKEDEKRFRQVILDGDLFKNIDTAAKEFNKGAQGFNEVISNIKAGQGSLGQLLKDPDVYNDMKTLMKNMNSIITEINTGKGTIGLLFKDNKLYNEFNTLIKKLNGSIDEFEKITSTISQGKGTLGKLVYDEKAYNNLLNSLTELKNVLQMLNSQHGSLSKFAKDDGKLYDLVLDTLGTTRDLVKHLKEGKGTLGLLFTDDKLYHETSNAVKQLRETIEEFRDQSPISTFGSMMFGTF